MRDGSRSPRMHVTRRIQSCNTRNGAAAQDIEGMRREIRRQGETRVAGSPCCRPSALVAGGV